MKKITIYRVNGVGSNTNTRDPHMKEKAPRFVLERNALDLLEGNEKYGNLSFCDAQIWCEEQATYEELVSLLAGAMTEEMVLEIANR